MIPLPNRDEMESMMLRDRLRDIAMKHAAESKTVINIEGKEYYILNSEWLDNETFRLLKDK